MKTLILIGLQFIAFFSLANSTLVTNETSLSIANNVAQPGDTIILKNGIWNNISIKLNCKGSSTKPIIIKAETQGKVIISGTSKLRIGGSYIIVDGLYFQNGFSGNDPVINFSIDKNTVANNCRVTNTVINDFNNPKRLDENYWIALYGKNNRIDHCTFLNKKNMGVLLAVILEDDKSRNNFHSIDHNYFGKRPPLASNTGEIIRVGVSQHCEFNSNTQITENVFEHCDGETEIISIKSCRNSIRNNIFKACQGSVVLRHGNYNIVEHNLFLGNDKEGTGGVRIINKGQWVVNNIFYKCRGEGFRSPISIMNGVPNSPAFRYVPVEDAVICNNTFVECSPLSFCDGSDTERSVTPKNIQFCNNIFYNTNDSILYKTYDNIRGFTFSGNLTNKHFEQTLTKGFIISKMTLVKNGQFKLPSTSAPYSFPLEPSILDSAITRTASSVSSNPGAKMDNDLIMLNANYRAKTGAKWFIVTSNVEQLPKATLDCKTFEEIASAVENNIGKQLVINLTRQQYFFKSPLTILSNISFKSPYKKPIKIISELQSDYLIYIKAGSSFSMTGISFDLADISNKTFVSSDTSGNAKHSKLSIINSVFTNINPIFFKAAKASVFDSIIVSKCDFSNSNGVLFSLNDENDKKGYYNVEHFIITGNNITNHAGQLIAMLRSGNDESTMGPSLQFSNNKISITKTAENNVPLISLTGVQKSTIENNTFSNCHESNILIEYKDFVRATHFFQHNFSKNSGTIESNKYVMAKNNRFE